MSEEAEFSPGAVTPYASVRYADADAAIAWLQATLGFGVKELVPADETRIADLVRKAVS